MPTPDQFKSPKLKIARARHHLQELEAVIAPWERAGFEASLTEHSGRYVASVTSKIDLPADAIQLVAADIVANLRSSLDQATSASVRILRGGLAKDTYFCISKDEDQLRDARLGKMRRVDQRIIDLIDGFGPTEAGSKHLWSLHCLSNLDKHNWTVSPTVFGFSMMEDGSKVKGAYDVATRTFQAVTVERPISFRFLISYSEVELILSEPLPQLLEECAGICERIVAGIESKTISLKSNQT